MFRHLLIRRGLLVSAVFSAFGMSLLRGPDGTRDVWAQPAAPKPSASIAPKDATPAPPVSAAPNTPSEPVATPDVAAPEAPPSNSTAPAGPPPELVAQWRAVFERGKAALAAGSFPLAARMLNDVTHLAPDPALRDQARELARLASYWAYNRLVLMPARNTLPPAAAKVRVLLEDKRSTDELGILYANTLIWGTGFGIVVGLGSDNSSAASYFLPAIGMSALGAGALAYIDLQHGPLPYGVPQSITSGMYMGLEAGIYMVGILEGERAVQNEDKVFPGLLWGSATAGALVGGLVGATVPITPGRASFTSSGAIWGGVLTSLVTIGIYDSNFNSAPFVTGLIGAAAGGVTTGILGGMLSPSIARVRFIDVGAFAGGLVFGGLYASLADRMDGQAFSFLTSAGVVAGLASSLFLTRNMETDEPRRGNAPKSTAWRASPFMTPHPGGGTLGLAGTF